MALLLTVIIVALIFEYINGFHDTADSIATVVSTKVLTARQAVALAAITNLVGALAGTAVAKTVSSGLVDSAVVTSETLLAALIGAIIWNLITWYYGLPSSSWHAVIGGLCGATLATTHGNWAALIWSKTNPGGPWWQNDGLLWKVVLPMVAVPVAGFIAAILMMNFLHFLVRNWRPATVSRWFGTGQLLSAGFIGHMHGMTDAQKTMGIIALALVTGTQAGALEGLPEWLSFLRIENMGPTNDHIPTWIRITCALVMAAGTAAGGWRIIKTMGHKIVRLQPIHGFAAETAGAGVVTVGATLGMPVSTTYAIATSIMGVGLAKRGNGLNVTVVQRILLAWLLTLPIAGLLAYIIGRIFMG